MTVTSNDTNISRDTTTNSGGVYSVPSLGPGRYSIRVQKTGFTDRVLNDIVLVSEQVQSQDIQLQVGAQTAQTVTVNASEGPALDTESATISGTFSSTTVQALPTFGRDTFQVAALAPGAFGDNARSNSGGSQDLPLPSMVPRVVPTASSRQKTECRLPPMEHGRVPATSKSMVHP